MGIYLIRSSISGISSRYDANTCISNQHHTHYQDGKEGGGVEGGSHEGNDCFALFNVINRIMIEMSL